MTEPCRILYSRERDLTAAEFRAVLADCALGAIRPIDDIARLAAMIEGANLIVTARRDEPGRPLVGVARSITDFSWCCYLSDLAVSEKVQGLGIGRGLVAETRRVVGPQVSLILAAVPEAVGFYRSIGMADMPDAFVFKRER